MTFAVKITELEGDDEYPCLFKTNIILDHPNILSIYDKY